MKKNFLYIFFALFMCTGFAAANDTAGQLLPTGEIRFEKQDGIVLKHEALLLSDTVTVDYLFENITDKPVETTVFFPIPTIGPVTSAYTEIPHDFKFHVWINGQEIIPEITRKVTLDGTDVTKYFNLMGIDTYYKAIEYDPADFGKVFEKAVEPLLKLPLEEQKKLEELGLIAKGCLGREEIDLPAFDYRKDTNCDKALADYELVKQFTSNPEAFKKEGKELPSYIELKYYISPETQVISHYHPTCRATLPPPGCINNPNTYHLGPGTGHKAYNADAHYKQEVMYYWKQTFPPHKTIHVRHEYKPSIYGNSIGAASSAVEKVIGWHPGEKSWYESSYIITTANNWKTPIEKFNLLVWGRSGAAVSTMGNKGPTYVRVAPKNYLLDTKQDFMPTSEISFELASDYEGKMPKIIPQLYRVDGPANVRAKPDGKTIKTLENNVYIWAYPSDKKNWYAVLLDEQTTGYTHKDNLIPFGKIDK